jgi:hypothetical protein
MLPNSIPVDPTMNSHTPACWRRSFRNMTLPTTKVVLPKSPMPRWAQGRSIKYPRVRERLTLSPHDQPVVPGQYPDRLY